MHTFQLPAGELARRQDALRTGIERAGLDAMVVFGLTRIFYLSAFFHVPTERPVALVVPLDRPISLLVPALEEEHLRARVAELGPLGVYPEYPGTDHPMHFLERLLADIGLAHAHLGADADGYGDYMGYRGPALSTLVDQPVRIVPDLVDDLRLIKSAAELDVLRTAGAWAARTHRQLQDSMRVGVSETEISRQAQWCVADELDGVLAEQGNLGGAASVHASFRSGPRTSMAHALMGNRKLQPGDNLVSFCLGTVSGYSTELERTMFLGEPSPRQRELFEAFLSAQDLGYAACNPGRGCAEIEATVRGYLIDRGFADLIKHHNGHGIGLEGHERPFFDLGDQTVLQLGMVFSVEPGLYVPGLGGFRHSDTVALTETGIEVLTPYPRGLADMIVEPR
jgi:Xaa-Pro aminopeptidase